MEFELTVDRSKKTYVKLSDVEVFLKEYLAIWNNFNHLDPVNIKIKKVPSQTATLGIEVREEIDTSDLFGQS